MEECMPYNCIVIVREVLDTRDLIGSILGEDDRLLEETLTTRFEPEDLNALEMALSIKDKYEGSVTVLSLGGPKNVDVLRECLYRGVDNVIRVEGADVGNMDTLSVANIFAKAIQKLPSYDIILSGVDVVEGENSLLGVCIAQYLGLEHISYVDNLENVGDGNVACKRAVEMGYEVVSSKLPAVITVGVALQKDDPRSPRSAKAALKLKKKKVPIEVLGMEALGIDDPVSVKTIVTSGYTAVEQKTVESKQVDPESEAELKEMLNAIMKS